MLRSLHDENLANASTLLRAASPSPDPVLSYVVVKKC